ncbi:sarcosine oxidase subunit gamma [Pararhodobacter sp.]|uniref:sarcosine oxidase subunit gamma n=1 Tax=Pararhodobacter sp. TaxID=2127056 RepID=UPI002AFE545A|nr:sarcosine oxidase subunit gamma [Pararhodobacter sp.]
MADLKAKAALGGLPLTHGRATLDGLDQGVVTSIAPYPGLDANGALSTLGLRFPDPGTLNAQGATRIIWAGRDMAFLLGARAPEALRGVAALTDQSDAWVWLHLTGPDARAVLARLTPLDLRDAAFGLGHVARTLVGHMSAILIHSAPEAYEIAVFRSMAGTLKHEVSEAMRGVAGRAAAKRPVNP